MTNQESVQNGARPSKHGDSSARRSQKRVGIRDVASYAGVAVSSVSRVLNDHPNVTPKLRLRVENAVSALGYQVDLVGASLRSGSTKTVGFLINNIANGLFADIMLGAESVLSRAGYVVTLISAQGRNDLDVMSLFVNRRVEGVLLSLADDSNTELHKFIEDSIDFPIVLVDRHLPVNCSSVLTDHQSGIDLAVDTLFAAGHRRISLLVGSMKTRPGRERARAFKHACVRLGYPDDHRQVVMHEDASAVSGEKTMCELIRESDGSKPTAVIVGGGQLLQGVLTAAQKEGIKIGQDISVIACDDTPLAKLYTPSITVTRRDVVEIGRKAAELLLSEMIGEARAPSTVVMPFELVQRESISKRYSN